MPFLQITDCIHALLRRDIQICERKLTPQDGFSLFLSRYGYQALRTCKLISIVTFVGFYNLQIPLSQKRRKNWIGNFMTYNYPQQLLHELYAIY